MKPPKAKSPARPKKPAEAGTALKTKKTTSVKYEPTEEEIREKAMEIYYERIARGEHGTPESDWHEAQDLLRGS